MSIIGGIIEEWTISSTAFHNRNKGFYLSDQTIFQISDSGCMHNNYTNHSLYLCCILGICSVTVLHP